MGDDTIILILGGYGFTGSLLARHLLEQTEAGIVLAGRHPKNAQPLVDELNTACGGRRVSSRRVDAASREDLLQALAGVDLLLVAAPTTRHAETVIRAAIDARVDYLDVQLDARKLTVLKSLAPEIERAGLCFITEAGFHPGLPAVMVRHAAAQLDRLEEATVAGYLNMGRSMPYSDAVDELMEAFRHYEAQTYRDGRWTEPGQYTTREIDFGGEIGPRRCFSMFFEELRDLPVMYPTLRELGFYMASTHWLVDWVITPLVMAGLKIPSRRLTRRLGKIMWWGMQTLPPPPYTESDRVILFGGCNTWPSVLQDTWAYDTNTNTWAQMSDGPENHLGPRLAYDSESDRVILFGGFTYPGLIARDDTWAYDFNSDTWMAMNPGIRPNGRNYQGLTYDVESDRVILWGGSDTYGEFDNSVWAYDYNTDSWEELMPGDGPWPRAREYAALTYDNESDRVILFGGITDRLDDRDETWAYDYNSNTWALMEPNSNPGSLSKVALAYSDAADRVILFGGLRSFPQKEYTDATWAYDFNSDTWEEMKPR